MNIITDIDAAAINLTQSMPNGTAVICAKIDNVPMFLVLPSAHVIETLIESEANLLCNMATRSIAEAQARAREQAAKMPTVV